MVVGSSTPFELAWAGDRVIAEEAWPRIGGSLATASQCGEIPCEVKVFGFTVILNHVTFERPSGTRVLAV
jgi:hypothetical protein